MQKYFVNVTNQSPEARSMGRSSKWQYLGTFYSDAAFALRDLLYFKGKIYQIIRIGHDIEQRELEDTSIGYVEDMTILYCQPDDGVGDPDFEED